MIPGALGKIIASGLRLQAPLQTSTVENDADFLYIRHKWYSRISLNAISFQAYY